MSEGAAVPREVKIVIEEMEKVVSGMEDGVGALRTARTRLSGYTSTYNLDASPADLQPVITWADDAMPGLRRRLSLAQWLDTQRPDGIPGVVEIPESELDQMLSDLPPAEARREGREAAEALLEADGELDPELAALIEENQHDPYFAAGFAAAGSPEEIAEAVWWLNAGRQHLGHEGYEPAEERETYLALVEAVGTTLGTATRNTGDLAPPDGYADQWATVITAPPAEDEERGGRQQALAMLLQHGVYETSFLDDLGGQLYDFERSHDGEPVWGPRAEDPFGVVVWDANGNPALDVMPYLMTALSNNPEAAQHFFSRGGDVTVELDGESYQVNERLQYLIQERTWSDSDGSDEGAGLGAALEAATTTVRDRTYEGKVSAQIASQTFALIGEQTGEGADGGFMGISADDGWQMWPGMRENVAAMLGNYMPDVFRIADDERYSDSLGGDWYAEANEMFPEGMPYGAALNREHVQRILETLGQDEDHVNTVLAGAAVTQQLALSHALEVELANNPNAAVRLLEGDRLPQLQQTAITSAKTTGWIVESAYTGAKDDEELQQQRAQAMANVINIASTLPIVPKVEGEWLNWLADQGKSHALKELGNVPASADATYGEMDDATQQALSDRTLNSILAAGYLDESVYQAANEQAGGQTFTPPPEDALTTNEDGEQVFDFDSQAYRDWYQVQGFDDVLQTNVVGPYNSMWPNIP